MDKKSAPPDLDPKLQEAYDRVMGTNISPLPSSTPAGQNPAVTPPAPTQTTVPPIASSQNPDVTVSHSVANEAKSTSAVQFYSNPNLSEKSQKKEEKQKAKKSEGEGKGGKGSKIGLILLLLIVFFLLYTVVWVKVFNLQLPFLPQ